MGIRDQNMNAELLHPILSTREKKIQLLPGFLEQLHALLHSTCLPMLAPLPGGEGTLFSPAVLVAHCGPLLPRGKRPFLFRR